MPVPAPPEPSGMVGVVATGSAAARAQWAFSCGLAPPRPACLALFLARKLGRVLRPFLFPGARTRPPLARNRRLAVGGRRWWPRGWRRRAGASGDTVPAQGLAGRVAEFTGGHQPLLSEEGGGGSHPGRVIAHVLTCASVTQPREPVGSGGCSASQVFPEERSAPDGGQSRGGGCVSEPGRAPCPSPDLGCC